MRRLILVFAGRTRSLVGNAVSRLIGLFLSFFYFVTFSLEQALTHSTLEIICILSILLI